jgi:hypothetical protein
MTLGWRTAAALIAIELAGSGATFAQAPFVYPARGQSPSRQARDQYECHSWAVQQTGFDPAMAQAPYVPPPPSQTYQGGGFMGGGFMGGAFRGGALGAVGGAIGGDAGKGAAIGAATFGLFGAFRRRSEEMRQEQQQAAYQQEEASAQATRNQERGLYNRAYAACLRGRGYSVD